MRHKLNSVGSNTKEGLSTLRTAEGGKVSGGAGVNTNISGSYSF